MSKNESSDKQLNLFSPQDERGIEKTPRPKNEPVELDSKNTDASSSAFGWRFQIIAGIVISLENIKEMTSVEMEGSTEDIEIYFSDKDPEYIQAKSVQRNPIDAKDLQKATDAMNTLINTSNITEGKYSELMYVVNFRNPLNLSNAEMEAAWVPRKDEAYFVWYKNLSNSAQKFVQQRVRLAQKELGKKYLSSTENFHLEQLRVATILLDANDQSSQKYQVLEGTLEKVFSELEISLSRAKIRSLKDMLVEIYLANAGSKKQGELHKKITKEMLVWRMIMQILDGVPEDFFDKVPVGLQDDLDVYENNFIQFQVEKIEVINTVMTGFVLYVKEEGFSKARVSKAAVDEFIEKKWMDYKSIFPSDEDDLLQEFGIKMIMLKILNAHRNINKIKKGVNMK